MIKTKAAIIIINGKNVRFEELVGGVESAVKISVNTMNITPKKTTNPPINIL